MKNFILRIQFSKNNPTTPHSPNKAFPNIGSKTYYSESQVVMLVQLAKDGSYTIYRILPRQIPPSSNNKLLAYKGNNYQTCLEQNCLEKIALKFYGLQAGSPNDYSFQPPREEDLNSWKTDPYVKAILNNQQER